MSIKQYLFKPGWQHKDPQVRAEAVTQLDEPELRAALPRICLEDEDSRVRMAAARRINDLSILLTASGKAAEPAEASLLAERVRALACATGAERPPLAQRLAVITSSNDRELLELAARQSPEAELRAAAVARVSRPGVLGDIAIHDPDPAIRRQAADRIDQPSSLQRVIEGTRKTDKALHQALLARVQAERLKAGDPAAVRAEAERLCHALEQLNYVAATELGEQMAAVERDWIAIAALVEASLHERFAALREHLLAPAPEPTVDVVDSTLDEAPAAGPGADAAATESVMTGESAEEPIPAPAPLIESPEPESPAPEAELADAARTEAEATAEHKQQSAKAALSEEHQALLASLKEQLHSLQQLLEAGDLHGALNLRHALLEAGKPLGSQPAWRRLRQQVQAGEPRLRELRDWLHWSNNKLRQRLVDEMRELPTSHLHPDAVLEKIKLLQAEWKSLEQSEQVPGTRHVLPAPGLWRQFQAAGQAAFTATKPFLDKRSEQQNLLLQAVRERIAALAAEVAREPVDWDALRTALRASGADFARLNELPAKHRKGVARSLREAVDKARAQLAAQDASVAAAKQKLIQEAGQLGQLEDRVAAMRAARQLQKQWQAAGRLASRKREQELWEAFRAPIDPLFAAAEEAQKQEQAELTADIARQQALCDQFAELLAGPDSALPEAGSKVQGWRAAWRDVPRVDKRLRDQFTRLEQQYEQRLKHQRGAADRDRRTQWWHKAALLRQARAALSQGGGADALAALQGQWPASGSRHALDVTLDAAWNALLEQPPAATDTTAAIAAARLLSIRMEFLAGLPSPESEREARMAYQVQRLSATLSGGQRIPAAQEAAELEREWLLQAYVPDPEFSAFERRFRAALDEIEKIK